MYSVVLSTCKNEKEAKTIANVLLKEKLVACVNIIGKIQSMAWWKNKIISSEEHLLIIKTKKSHVNEVISTIKKNHSYKVPEIIELPIGKGDKDYLDWISEVTK